MQKVQVFRRKVQVMPDRLSFADRCKRAVCPVIRSALIPPLRLGLSRMTGGNFASGVTVTRPRENAGTFPVQIRTGSLILLRQLFFMPTCLIDSNPGLDTCSQTASIGRRSPFVPSARAYA